MTLPVAYQNFAKHLAKTGIEAVIAEHQIRGLAIQSVLKADWRADIFLADLNGTKTVLKWYKGKSPPRQVDRAAAELEQLRPYMSQGPLQVNLPLKTWPEVGLIALSFAPGRQLNELLLDADRARRDALFGQAAQWAALYGHGRRQDGHIKPRFWIKKMSQLDCSGLEPDQEGRTQALIRKMRGLMPKVIGARWPRGQVHGDLIGTNLMVDGDVMTGVDVNGAPMRPLAAEAAHFLVWQALWPPVPADKDQFLDQMRADRRAFLAYHPAVEDDAILRFFTLQQLCVRQVGYAKDPVRSDALRWAIAEYLC